MGIGNLGFMTKLNFVGWLSAILATGLGTTYSVFQIFSELKLIQHPVDLYWLLSPSLLLAPAFLIAMICLHYFVESNLKIFTAISVAFAVLYCADVTMVYFTQLAVVLPAELSNQINEKQVLLFYRRTFLMAVDCLGYFFMSLSTLFAAFAFAKGQK